MEIGKFNSMRVVKHVDFGVYLDGEELGEVLMPIRYVPENCEDGDTVEVFLYVDSEDRPIATTEKPFAQVGDFAALKVKSVSKYGAFLDWGLMKDLLVPFSEQKINLEEGNTVVVYIYLDGKTNRIAASAKVEKFTAKEPFEAEPETEVDLLVCKKTDLGYKAIINNKFLGLLYENEVFKPLYIGQRVKGYVKQIREDGKVDLRLQKSGFQQIVGESENLLVRLQKAGGFLATTDKTPAEEIYSIYGISKKMYKKAVGDLYKKRLISIEEEGIRLIEK